jgi:hypothetical protein
MVPSPKQLIHALGTGHPETLSYKPKLQCFMWDPMPLFDNYSIRTTFQQVLFVSNFERSKSHRIHPANSDWTLLLLGSKVQNLMEKWKNSAHR